MQSHTGLTAKSPTAGQGDATASGRIPVDIRRFPWIRRLASDYAFDYARLADFFAGDARDTAAWRDAIGRASRHRRQRDAVVQVLRAQQQRRGAPPIAQATAAVLGDPASVAVVTGQQAGVFGGPLYTVFKAITAIQLARRVRATTGVEAVPVFWVDSEDHDWQEIRSARILDKDANVVDIVSADPPGAGPHPVGGLEFDAGIGAAVDRLAEQLAPSEFTADVLAALRRRYQTGASVGAAFAGWMDDLLGRHGLVVFESDDASLKPLVADLFAHEIESRSTSKLARKAADSMDQLGHTPQVVPADEAVALFYVDGAGRRGIKARGAELVIGDAVRSAADLKAEALAHPERFSPNVLLRPIVQDRIFPTVCYVSGPAELAYQAQLGGVYREFGVEAPLLYSRASATLADGAAMRFLERSSLALETMHGQDDSVLNQWLANQLPAELERGIAEADTLVSERIDALKASVSTIDPTLAGAVDTTRDKMRETLKTLHSKIIQAAKRKDDTLRRQFVRTRALTFPEGVPQERSLNVVFFANRYGLNFADALLDSLPLETDKHYVLTL